MTYPYQKQKPRMVLSVVGQQDGSIRLLVDTRNESMQCFFDTENQNACLNMLMHKDAAAIDEWIDFIVRLRAKTTFSNYDYEENGCYYKTILQYFNICMEWRLTTVAYCAASEQMEITLESVETEWEYISSWQWREISQANRMSKTTTEGNYWEIDLVDHLIFVSKLLAATLQLGGGALVMPLNQFLEKVHPDDLELVRTALENVVYGQQSVCYRYLPEDGSVVYFRSYAIPMYDREGKFTRIMGRVQNITQQELAIEELAYSEQRFRNIIETSSDAYIFLNEKGMITYTSSKIRNILGKEPMEVMGQRFDDFLYKAAEGELSVRRFKRAVKRAIPVSEEICVVHSEGRPVWLRINLSFLINRFGQLEVIAVCRDISAEKKQHEKMSYLAHHDALTGVYNRARFEIELQTIEQKNEIGIGLIMADLNGLKIVNDAFGHKQGDDLLITAAKLISNLAAGQIVARIGGDEFAVFTRRLQRSEVELLSEQIMDACNSMSITQNDKSLQLPMSVSCGVAYRHNTGQSIRELYEKAEQRMHRKKMFVKHSVHSQVIASLKEALKTHNVETSDHMQRMERMVIAIGKRLNLPSGEFDRLMLLSSLHDIGKVSIPQDIIDKPCGLSDEEWSVMKRHSEAGARIAMATNELNCIANEICAHHERWDGKGYPRGLKGEEIPLLSRIVSVADTYDVMTNRRVYKQPVSHDEAIRELIRCSGTQFDPEIVAMFIELFGEVEPAVNF